MVAGALAALAAAGMAAGSASAEMTPALENRLAVAPAGQEVDVIAVLHRQVDGARFARRPGALLRALRTTAERTQDDVTETVSGEVRGFWLVNAVAFSGTAEEIREVAAHAAVSEVDIDRPVRVDDAMADVTPYPSAPGGNWGLDAISAPAAWSGFGVRGTGVRVGIIDTGVSAGHPALAGKVVAWRDFIGGRHDAYDDNGHGSHTAGTIAGGDAGGAPIGVAPDAQLVVAKAMGANGAGPGSALLAAAEWMTDPDGNPATADQPAVVNNSWSSSGANDLWFRPMIQRWRELGIVPVFSAGNTGPGPQSIGSPASYPEVVAVGAVDADGAVAPFSSRGPVIWQDLDGAGPSAGTVLGKPDLAAPGVNIVSSVDGGYLSYSGTSMAAPHASGVVALMRQANPGLSPDRVAQILRASAVDVAAPGHDADTGAGRLDAGRAIAMATGSAPAPPPPPPAPTASAPAAAPTAGVTFVQVPRGLTNTRVLTYRVRLSGDAELVRLRVDGGPWGPAVRGDTVSVGVPEGRHVIEAQALNADGRSGAPPARHAVTVDRTRPTLRIGWRTVRGRTTFVVRARDENGIAPGSVRWDLGHGDMARGRRAVRRFADPAPRRVLVQATDRAGNVRRVARTMRVPRTSTPVRGLRVRRGGKAAVLVTGVAVRPGRVVVRVRGMRRAGAGQHATRPVLARRPVGAIARPVARGRFAVRVPVRTTAPGRYRVELALAGAGSLRAVALR